MRILVLSDIHANLAAFTTVLEDATGEWDKIWCLGDVVGYGPDPNECVERLREQEHVSLSGNHDWAVLGKIDIETFNPEARAAIRWTQEALSAESRAYLDVLPPLEVHELFTLAHASPRQPVWEYILDRGTAAANFAHFETRYCLVGHTHTPILFRQQDTLRASAEPPLYAERLSLNDTRLIINPGSVGQPRDADPRAAYGLLDLAAMTWEHRRVAYPVEQTQARMRDAKLPYRLVARLQYGW